MPRLRLASRVALALVAAALGGRGLAAGEEGASPLGGEDWFRPEVDPAELRRALGDERVTERWIYQDLNRARQEARRTGKPILAVFRCVPCGSAPGLDGALCTAGGAEASSFEAQIRDAGGGLDALLDAFVAVRVVKMNGVNRRVFQFDRDLPFVAMFLNAEGAVYGRYGTRDSNDRKNLPHLNLPSFQQALQRALELHRGYPANAPQLAAKLHRGDGTIPAMAEDMPTFEPFPEKYNPTTVKNCIHCHTVGEAETRATLAAGTLALRDLWRFPEPENLGLEVDDNHGRTVRVVHPGSPADVAGIRRGDVLERVAGQPLTSKADIHWALHHAPDTGALPVAVSRGGRLLETEVALGKQWRRSATYWRASLTPMRPGLHLRPDPYKEKKGAAPDGMGLAVHYPSGSAAAAGFRNGDLLVAVDGRTDLLTEADVLHYLYFEHPEVESVACTILREGARSTLTLPVR